MKYLMVMYLAHRVGDYLFQTSEMAHEKNKRGFKGWLWSLYHAGLYALIISISLGLCFPEFHPTLILESNLQIINIYALSFFLFTWWTHAIIDHYSLGKVWSTMMKSDTLPDFSEKSCNSKDKRTVAEIYKIAFNSFVYITVDNTLHLTLQAIALILLEKFVFLA